VGALILVKPPRLRAFTLHKRLATFNWVLWRDLVNHRRAVEKKILETGSVTADLALHFCVVEEHWKILT
jgi:hypothetical protein